MAELLIKVDPACLQANEQAGHVVMVQEDGFAWSELEQKLFVIARIDMTVEEAKAMYLKTGIPDDVMKAAQETRLPVDLRNYPSRETYHDTTLYPDAVQAVVDCRAAITACHDDAKEAARQAVESLGVVTELQLPDAALKSLKTVQIKQVAELNAPEGKADQYAEAILAASRQAYKSVQQPVLDAITPYGVVDLTQGKPLPKQQLL